MAAIKRCPWKGNVNYLKIWGIILNEKHLIQKVLQHTNGYKPEAARLLGIGLTTLYKKMEAYGL